VNTEAAEHSRWLPKSAHLDGVQARLVGLSQVELAARAKMTQPARSRLEAGGVIPTIPLLDRISAALDADSSSR
jgi:predicted transcriptional regulator